jgi:phosphatidylserine decarboxylase
MKLAPEGKSFILTSGFGVAFALWLSLFTGKKFAFWLLGITSLWLVIVLQFFRDPDRYPPNREDIILSPADGRVISISPSTLSPLEPKGKRVSIFMSPINVHVNRSPVMGTVKHVEHFSGKFLTASKIESERENERTMTLVDTKYGEVAFCQIAGFLARRIVLYPKPGDKIFPGERIGVIKFGSRMDVYFPDDAEIIVQMGQHVKAGETILAEF